MEQDNGNDAAASDSQVADNSIPEAGSSAANGKRKPMEKEEDPQAGARATKKTSKVCMLSNLTVSFAAAPAKLSSIGVFICS
jgi:hypothetical protein